MSERPVATAIVGTLASVWAVWASGPGAMTPAYVVFALAGTALLVITLTPPLHMLPNAIVYPMTALILVLLLAAAITTGAWNSMGRAVLGGAVSFGVFVLLFLIAPRAIGLGIVKLSVPLAALLAWHSWPALLLGIYVSFISAGIIAMTLLAINPAWRHRKLPFGPFQLLGTVAALTAVHLGVFDPGALENLRR